MTQRGPCRGLPMGLSRAMVDYGRWLIRAWVYNTKDSYHE